MSLDFTYYNIYQYEYLYDFTTTTFINRNVIMTLL